MPLFVISLIAYIQAAYTAVQTSVLRCKRRWIHPIIYRDGYDMVMLKDGSWIGAGARIPDAAVIAKYNAEKHQIIAIADNGGAPLRRWDWLSVVSGGVDCSDFFNSIRISHSLLKGLTPMQLLLLFAHQTGRLLVNEITLVLRNGDITTLPPLFATPPTVPKPETPKENVLDYVR